MERSKNIVKPAGYIPQNKLLEINRDALRAMQKDEKQTCCKALIREAVKWCCFSAEEAIGILESSKFHFMQVAEDVVETEAQPKVKKLCRSLSDSLDGD